MQAMCGDQFLRHVVLCTTMRNSLPDATAFAEAEAREHKLPSSPDLLHPLLAKGVQYMRYTGTQKTGAAIVQSILERPATHAMNLQLELQDPKCALEDNSAGRIITAEVRRKEEKMRQELAEEEEEERELREELKLERKLRGLKNNDSGNARFGRLGGVSGDVEMGRDAGRSGWEKQRG
jgi:hypothetical protein